MQSSLGNFFVVNAKILLHNSIELLGPFIAKVCTSNFIQVNIRETTMCLHIQQFAEKIMNDFIVLFVLLVDFTLFHVGKKGSFATVSFPPQNLTTLVKKKSIWQDKCCLSSNNHTRWPFFHFQNRTGYVHQLPKNET